MNLTARIRLAQRSAAPTAAFASCVLLFAHVSAQQLPLAKAQAPENHTLLKQTIDGGYFIARPLKDEYDRLVERLRLLKSEIDRGQTTGAAAVKELGELQTALAGLRAEIEAKKVLVPLAHIRTATQTVTFDLGPERRLFITAEDVHVVGWDQPQVKCELEKSVLSADENPADAELEAIKLVHRHSRDTQKVGRSLAETQADEEKFLASDDGKKLTPEAREQRRQLVEDIFLSWAHFADFQDKEIDLLEIEGLTHPQGNRQIRTEVSYDKGKTNSAEWRRHARLTVFVPQANFVAITSGGVHNWSRIDIRDLKASLVLASHGTFRTASDEPFQVRSLEGSLRVKQVPLDLIDGVTGNVNIVATVDHSIRVTSWGTGTGAIVGTRYPPLPCVCKNVGGDLVGWFGRVDVQLEGIQGRIDVRNEFGDTKLTIAGPPSQAAHRIISESGRIELSLSRKEWGDFPLWAVTQAGTFRSSAPREFLEEFNVTTKDDAGAQRAWVGLRRGRGRAAPFDPTDFQNLATRLRLALAGDERVPGFDLISRGGAVVVDAQP
jgi:hypothetical protein